MAFGGVRLSVTELALMFGLAFVGTVPFAAMGLLVALLVPPANAAAGVVNLIYLPMSFLGGLWFPLRDLPHWLQKLAPVMPTYHVAQLMLSIFGYQQPGSVAWVHWYAELAGFTAADAGGELGDVSAGGARCLEARARSKWKAVDWAGLR